MTEQEKTKNQVPTAVLRPQHRRRLWLKISFAVCVIIPSILGILYYAFVGSDRYVASAGFAIRSMSGGAKMDILGSFTGLANAGSERSDSYIVMKYMKSRDMLEHLRQDFDLQSVYGESDIDFLSRLDASQDVEKILKYWRKRVSTSFDSTSGIIDFEVQAFSAEDSKLIADQVLVYVQDLVNELSEKARKDAVGYAERELGKAEERLLKVRRRLRIFREEKKSIDPLASAMNQIELLSGMERELMEVRTRMASLEGVMDADAPSMETLRHRADALELQIAEKRGGLNVVGVDDGLSTLISEYEELQIEKEFAQKAYASALASLETARVDAGRQQRYLAVYSTPAIPEEPLYPRRILGPILVVLVSTVVWGISTLIVYAVRDHLS